MSPASFGTSALLALLALGLLSCGDATGTEEILVAARHASGSQGPLGAPNNPSAQIVPLPPGLAWHRDNVVDPGTVGQDAVALGPDILAPQISGQYRKKRNNLKKARTLLDELANSGQLTPAGLAQAEIVMKQGILKGKSLETLLALFTGASNGGASMSPTALQKIHDTFDNLTALATENAPKDQPSYVFSESAGTRATHVVRKDVCLDSGVLVEFHTDDIADATTGEPDLIADPVMHILRSDGTNYEEVFYDDDSFDGRNPSITFVAPTISSGCTNFRILIRAYDNDSGGKGGQRFSLFVGDSQIPLDTYRLGGYQIDPHFGVGDTKTLETVRVNEVEASAAAVYRFEKAADGHFAYAARAFSGGVGNLTAKLSGSAATADPENALWVIATPYTDSREGPVRVLQNAVAEDDEDGDGLSSALEFSLGLCPNATSVTIANDCTNVDPRDTDGDGLLDRYEAIGFDNEFFPQELYRWGADPRHKDIFVEVDRQEHFVPGTTDTVIADRYSEATLEFVAERYDALNLIDNPDGVSGIKVHFDVDFNCLNEIGDLDGVAGDNDGITDLCGSFGGASVVPAWTVDPGLAATGFANFSPERFGLFHWVVDYNGGIGTAGRDCWALAVGNNHPTSDPNNYLSVGAVLAHELGHNLNLYHAAHPDGTGFNRNPIYPSMVNYSYDYARNGDIQNIAFSTGERAPLNSRDLSEDSVYSPGVDVSFLGDQPFSFLMKDGKVDWNRDGLYDSSVRASLGPEPRQPIGIRSENITPVQVDMEAVVGVTSEVGPAAVEFEATTPLPTDYYKAIWLVVNNATNNTFWYRHRFTEGPFDWGYWYQFGTQVFRAGAEPTAAVFDGPLGPRLYVFGVEHTPIHNVRYVEVDRDRSGAETWMTITNPAGVEFESLESAVLGDKLYIVGRDMASNELWLNSLSATSGLWSGWSAMRIANGDPVMSDEINPGMASGPDGRLYLFPRRGDGQTNADQLGLYTLDPASEASWSDESGKINPNGSCTLVGKPGVVYRPHVDADGQPLARGNGGFWIWYRCLAGSNIDTNYLTSRGIIDANGPDTDSSSDSTFGFEDWYMVPDHYKNDPCRRGSATAVAVTVSQVGVEAFMTQAGDDCQETSLHLPYADGHSSLLVRDHNDHAEMAARLRSSLISIFNAELCEGLSADIQCSFE